MPHSNGKEQRDESSESCFSESIFDFDRAKSERILAENKEEEQLLLRGEGTFVLGEDKFTFNRTDIEIETTELEHGSFGGVSKAKLTRKGKELTFAVKSIAIQNNPNGDTKGSGAREIRAEVDILLRLKHENIIIMHGYVIQETTCYICMELMDTDLRKVQHALWPPTVTVPAPAQPADPAADIDPAAAAPVEDAAPAAAADSAAAAAAPVAAAAPAAATDGATIERFLGCIAVSIVDALVYLRNEPRVIHRDIKPDNILVNANGDIKLADFGVSKKLQTGLSSTRYAGNTDAKGRNVKYFAPECFDLKHEKEMEEERRVYGRAAGIGSKSQVWSMGMVLYVLATGVYPYAEPISHNIVEGNPPHLTDKSFTLGLRSFIQKCLTKAESTRGSVLEPGPNTNSLKSTNFYKAKKDIPAEERRATVQQLLQQLQLIPAAEE